MYSTAVVAAALGIRPSALRTWSERSLFSTPIPLAVAGHPRQFPLLAVYEAAALSWASKRGILPLMVGAWFNRVHVEFDNSPGLVTDAAAAFAAAFDAGALRDFDRDPPRNEVFWAILVDPAPDHLTESEQYPRTAGGVIVGHWSALEPKLFGCGERLGAVMFNVSALVRDTQDRLAGVAG